MEYETLKIQTEENITILYINRPDKLNALNRKVLEELECAIYEIQRSDARALIITGEGEKAFVAGADIGEMVNLNPVEAREFAATGQRVFAAIEDLDIVTIAAVNGYALGGGMELAMACDIRIAGKNAVFGQPEVSLGITPGFGGTWRLARIAGIGIAMDLILSGRKISAEDALQMGLVSAIADDPLEMAKEMAAKIVKNSAFAIGMAKKLVKEALNTPREMAMDREAALFALCFSNSDQRERMESFLRR